MVTRRALICAMALVPASALGQEAAARQAANTIIQLIAAKKFAELWDVHVSDWFKQRLTRDAFLGNMALGRSMIGQLTSSNVVQTQHSTFDPGSGYSGDIYTFMFLNTYSNARFYETVVVIKEPDGRYRISGLQGAPA